MCGIGGAISHGQAFFDSPERLRRFGEPMQYRGPDAEGYLQKRLKGVFVELVHKRLSIIDLTEEANQPMWSPSGQTVMVFNGEIYNYRELKRELEGQGRRFNTNSDTEVLLVGYEEWGLEALLQKVNGMFAFVLFDQETEETWLARDPFGKKPLYYYHHGGQLIFSSDIRSFQGQGLPLTLNLHSLGYFFAELSTPSTQSIWQEVNKLPAGHFMKYDGYALYQQSYWNLTFRGDTTLSRAEIIEETDRLVTQAVERRLVADVNVAAQLSGGVDSSLVVAKMASLSSKPVATYSVGFDEEKYNELPWAAQVAQRYQTNHTEFILQPQDIKKTENLILEYGEPFADSSMLPTYLICKEIAKTEKVVVGGDGGDELFAGYYIYYFVDKLSKVVGLKSLAPIVRLLAKMMPTYRVEFLARLLSSANQPRYTLLDRLFAFSPEQLSILFPYNPEIKHALHQEHETVWKRNQGSTDLLSHMLTASLHTRLVNDYLVKVDRASMYASLEMRSPLLDKDIAQFAATLSPNTLMKPQGTKSVLKEVAEKYLPYDLIYRNKMGFAVPTAEWFRGELKSHWEEVVLQGKQNLLPMDYDVLGKHFHQHVRGEIDSPHTLWSMFVFHIWAQHV